MTGQDATLTGLQNIISGYQCGTVYKPIYKEASAAVALAIYLRAGKKAPAEPLNGTVTDPHSHKKVPSVLETPEWVTGKTMSMTVIQTASSRPASCAPATRRTARSTGSSSTTDPLMVGESRSPDSSGSPASGLPPCFSATTTHNATEMSTTESTNGALLSLRGISKRFGPVQALTT